MDFKQVYIQVVGATSLDHPITIKGFRYDLLNCMFKLILLSCHQGITLEKGILLVVKETSTMGGTLVVESTIKVIWEDLVAKETRTLVSTISRCDRKGPLILRCKAVILGTRSNSFIVYIIKVCVSALY